ncbi:MAG: LpqB family beta-propeller domain-containing protein [Propionicimonas sp.]|uniref:LpqB family beta-propeller domain-containing protein n=1 Tax=Propionicimonas sp. TaxID=1955623 RepID=UPI002B21957E|nr:LpqB family beta-propeller domain-containing protein [Propionicimonas sp.]MEA4944685.1 LpqB family beta-propeller domain-containing protein [Propionicimonas sp.]MEA5052706.1 LpqB family beta-propeller domain-containing protein [Propionicimonas sp.]MEA5117379.1 LpqB family beta-propeller domain-containing protein [Propionicimonas sp.]
MRSRPRWSFGSPRLVRTAVAGLVGVLLVGCATVPTSGPVEEHQFGDEPANSSVRVAPVPPAKGASPMLIVEGFLHAMGTDQAGFAIARQYLTTAAARSWDPESRTTVYADGTPPRETENSVVLSTPTLGSLNANGEFSQETGRLSHDFGLVHDSNDQWRISAPPDGLLISRYDLTNNYSSVNLYFLDTTGTTLVPDPRYFPLNDATPLDVVRAQLDGPGWWLTPAVRPDVAEGIVADRVEPASAGVVSVQLSSTALSLDSDERRILLAELTWALTQLPEITGIQVNAGSTPLPLPGTPNTVLVRDYFSRIAPVDPQAAGRLFAFQSGQVRDVRDLTSWSQSSATAPAITQASALAVRADLLQFAAVSEDGTRLVTATADGSAATTLLEGTTLQRPAYSRQQELWALEAGADASAFHVFEDLANNPVDFATDAMPSDPVIAFRISPDGTRMALVLRAADTDTDQLGIARIVRDGDGVRLQSFRPIPITAVPEAGVRLLDVGWNTATQLLVLVSHHDTERTTSVVRVDQDASTSDEIGPNQVSGLTELAVIPQQQPVVRNATNVYRSEGDFNWKSTAGEVTALAYAG